MKLHLLSLLTGCGLDLILGDPHGMLHPVRAVGWLIGWMESWLRRLIPSSKYGELAAGVVLALLVPAVTGGTAVLLLRAAGCLPGGWCFFVMESVLTYYLLAARSLREESMKVYACLKAGDVEGARTAVSMIVGRDTQVLEEEGITKAAVETVAENASDGVIAPLFYLALGGPVLGWIYKAVNTMDSMVGYKNDQYINFGRYAAKFDDILNYIPARLCARLMIVSSYILKMDWKNAKKIYVRDRQNHASPNSAQTEAVMAGALRIQLAGDAWYFGKRYEKPTIGDAMRPVEILDIPRANRLLYATAITAMVLFSIIILFAALLF